MRSVQAWAVLLAGTLGCLKDPVKEEIRAYDAKTKAILARLNEAREALSGEARQTRGGTEEDLRAAGRNVKEKVLPLVEAIVKETEEMVLATPELQSLNRKLLAAFRLEREYFAGTAAALEAGDQAGMGAARRKSEAAEAMIEEWQTELRNLGGRYGLRL